MPPIANDGLGGGAQQSFGGFGGQYRLAAAKIQHATPRRPHPRHPPSYLAARKPDRAVATHRIATPLSVRSVRHRIHPQGGEVALPPTSLLEYHGLVAISTSTGIIDATVVV